MSNYKKINLQKNLNFKKIFSLYDIVDKNIFSKYNDFFIDLDKDLKKYQKYLKNKEEKVHTEYKNILIKNKIKEINLISEEILLDFNNNSSEYLKKKKINIENIEKIIKRVKKEYIKNIKLIGEDNIQDAFFFPDYIIIRNNINKYIFNYFVKEFILKKKIFNTHHNEKIINNDDKYDDLEELIYFFNLINNETSFCKDSPNQWACTDIYDLFFDKKIILGEPSLSGIVFKTNFSNFYDKPIIVKMSMETNIDKYHGDSLLYEYHVHKIVNKMNKYCPNFTLVYNYFNCTPANNLLTFVNKHKTQKNIHSNYFSGNFCSANKSTLKNEFLLSEYVPGGLSLYTYANRINVKNYDVINIILQTMSSVLLAQKKLQFVHNDLHSENIMVLKLKDVYPLNNNKHSYFIYILNNSVLPFVIIETKKIIKIIDYGRTHVKNKKINYSTLNDHSDLVIDEFDEYYDFSFLFFLVQLFLDRKDKSNAYSNYLYNFFNNNYFINKFKKKIDNYYDNLKKSKTKIIKIFKDFIIYNIDNNFIELNENKIKSNNVYVFNHPKKHKINMSDEKIKKLIIDYKKFLKNDIKKIDINKYI